ncbi:hypothetical protein ACSBR1_033881 [Camellia fascicularis]
MYRIHPSKFTCAAQNLDISVVLYLIHDFDVTRLGLVEGELSNLFSCKLGFFRGICLMIIVRGMQRSIREDQTALCCIKSFNRGIAVTLPKARTRDKLKIRVLYL